MPKTFWQLFSSFLFRVLVVGEGSGTLFPHDGKTCTEYARGGTCRANLEWTPLYYGPLGLGLYRRTLIYVYAQQGEVILMGSSSMNINAGDIHVYDPGQLKGGPGNEYMFETLFFSCGTAQPGKGRIASRAEEKDGPKDINGVKKGYEPCVYKVSKTGIYNVVFYPSSYALSKTIGGDIDLQLTENFDARQGSSTAAWDVTVRSAVDSVNDLYGRVYSYAWCMITGQNSRPVNMTVYPATPDGFRYRLGTAGIDANFWPVYGSNRGFKDGDTQSLLYHDIRGNDAELRELANFDASQSQAFAVPSIPHFLSPPDDLALTAMSFSLTPVIPTLVSFEIETKTILYQGGVTFFLTSDVEAVYEISIEDPANPNDPINRLLKGVAKGGLTTHVFWDGKSSEGNYFKSGEYQVKATLHGGEFHSMMIDVEANMGGGPQIELLNHPCVSPERCRTAFFDHRGYRSQSGVVVGAINQDICPPGSVSGPKTSGHYTAYDTFSKANSFGVSNGIDKTGADCNSTNSFGDAKGLDIWTYTASSMIFEKFTIATIDFGQTFVSTWKTFRDNEAIFLPIKTPVINLKIDWGDGGTPDTFTSDANLYHTYVNAGTYAIQIIGLLRGFNFQHLGTSVTNLISVEKWGGFVIDDNSSEAFAGCINFWDITANDQPMIDNGARLDYLFMNCVNLMPVSALKWDLSNAISLRGMFLNCEKFDAQIEFIITNVSDLSMMFAHCRSFNQVIIFKNSTKVTTIESLLIGCSSFNKALVIDSSNVRNMSALFRDATSFNFPLNLDTRSCEDMSFMFAGAKSLNFPLNFDARNVTTMKGMFMNCVSLNNHVSLSSGNVKTMSQMFRGAISFNFSVTFNTRSCEDMSEMFYNCISFDQEVPIRVGNVRTMQRMFHNASKFNQNLSFELSANLDNTRGMFEYAISYNSLLTINTSNVNDMSGMFQNAISYNQPLSLDTRSVITMASMFENATKYDQIIRFNTSRVSNMSRMFFGATAFSRQLVGFQTSTVLDMNEMFLHASVYGDRFAHWDVRQVERCNNFCEFCGLPSFKLCTPCDKQENSGRGTMTCGCPDGQTPSLNASLRTACVPVPCLPPEYAGLPGKCECGEDYKGKVEYLNNITVGCGLISCIEAKGYTGLPNNCTCAEGYYGTVQYIANDTTGCAPIPCTSPGFVGLPGECQCAPGYVGVVTYAGPYVIGCFRNETTVIVPVSNSSSPTIVNATGGVKVVLPKDPQYGGQGTVIITVNNQTQDTESTIVTIDFLDPSNKPKNISNLTHPFRFTIPLRPGASDAVSMCEGRAPVLVIPNCKWFDTVSLIWTSEGCTTVNLTSTAVECSCVHMTDFALVLPNYNRVPLQQFLDLTPVNVKKHPDGLMTVIFVLLLFIVLFVLSACRDRAEFHDSQKKSTAKNIPAASSASSFFPAASFSSTLAFAPSLTSSSSSLSSSSSSYVMSKWNDEVADVFVGNKASLWRRFKLGLQVYHTWAALLCRKSGTSFRSVDRVFVTLMMVLTLMSMSANFHRRDQNYFGRSIVIISSVLASLVPSQLLSFLFRHTGKMGYLERWQLDVGLQQPSRYSCLRYRFAARWRGVWYGLVLVIALMLILYILSIALMFDQNPWYYCRGQTTQAWVIDFLLQYTLTVFVVEPFKIFVIVLLQTCMRLQPKPSRSSSSGMMLEATYYQPLTSSQFMQ